MSEIQQDHVESEEEEDGEEDEEDEQDEEDETKEDSHPLQYAWSMWYNPPVKPKQASGNWTNNVKEIMGFRTVEEFWGLYNNLVPPSRLQLGSNYHMFKTGITPEWEDPANAKGGKWVINFKKQDSFDQAWELLLIAFVGDMVDDSDEITGVVISPRGKANRLAVWTANANNDDSNRRIGNYLKRLLQLGDMKVTYQPHTESLRTDRSYNPKRSMVV